MSIAELAEMVREEQSNVSTSTGITVNGTIQHFERWVDGKKKSEPTIWKKVYKNKKALPYTMVMNVESAIESAGRLNFVKNDNGDIIAYDILASVSGVFVKDKDTGEYKDKVDKRTSLNVRKVLIHFWTLLHDDTVPDSVKNSLHPSIIRTIDMFMENDEPKIKRNLWRRIGVNADVECTFFIYDEKATVKFMEEDSNGKWLMRENANIRLDGAGPELNISVYVDKECPTAPTEENGYTGLRFGFSSFKFLPFDYKVTIPDKMLFETVESKVDTQQRLFVPWSKYSEDTSLIQRNITLYIDNYGNWDHSTNTEIIGDKIDNSVKVTERVLLNYDEKNFLYKPNDGGKPSRQMTFKPIFFYSDITERYPLEIVCRPGKKTMFNPVDAYGILNPNAYSSIMITSQPLPSYVSCNVMKDASGKYPFNNLSEEEQNQNRFNVKGYYKLWGTRIIPHWKNIRDRYMFPVSGAGHVERLRNAAQQVSDRDNRKFKKVTEDDVEVYYMIDSFRDEVNPLNDGGKDSPVINFGNATSPAFESNDLGSLFSQYKLYAWTSFAFDGRDKPATEQKGDELLNKLTQTDIQYQIFGFKKSMFETNEVDPVSEEEVKAEPEDEVDSMDLDSDIEDNDEIEPMEESDEEPEELEEEEAEAEPEPEPVKTKTKRKTAVKKEKTTAKKAKTTVKKKKKKSGQ
jgi:hypothetical protein